MRMLLPDIIDRISILKLKVQNSKTLFFLNEFKKELSACESAIGEYKKEGVKIDSSWEEELYSINKYQWVLEAKMKSLKDESQQNLKEIGKIYIQLHVSNKRRVAVKNRISEETGSGFRDVKMN